MGDKNGRKNMQNQVSQLQETEKRGNNESKVHWGEFQAGYPGKNKRDRNREKIQRKQTSIPCIQHHDIIIKEIFLSETEDFFDSHFADIVVNVEQARRMVTTQMDLSSVFTFSTKSIPELSRFISFLHNFYSTTILSREKKGINGERKREIER